MSSSFSDSVIDELAQQLGALLERRGLICTTAESCTGGLVSAAITSVPGSSAWFETGFVTYANASKTSLLGVDTELIDREGAVSEAVVRAMALGACERSGAQVAMSVSGVAGPGGGSEYKPVGTVWLAWAVPDRPVETAVYQFSGGRSSVRQQAVAEALRGTIARIDNTPSGTP